jgi:glutamate/aspartate transport system substrate-binding protein
MDGQILAGNIANSKDPSAYHLVGEPISVEPIAIMVRKGDTLKKVGDQVIDEMAKSGELHKLYDKWFTKPIPPKNANLNLPASAATKAAWEHPNDKPVEEYQKKS